MILHSQYPLYKKDNSLHQSKENIKTPLCLKSIAGVQRFQDNIVNVRIVITVNINVS